jgi:hypothetical protein
LAESIKAHDHLAASYCSGSPPSSKRKPNVAGNTDSSAPKSLKDKFQFKNVRTLVVRNAPPGYLPVLAEGMEGIEIIADSAAQAAAQTAGQAVAETGSSAQAILLFVNNLAEAREFAPAAVAAVAPVEPEGIVWIAYPKGGKGVKTDVNRDKLWPVVQELGWRPVRQVAIDEVWSAMRFRPGNWVQDT